MRVWLIELTVLVLMLASRPAAGITLRYALVIGNNIGVDADGRQPFPPLKHAEREAETLREELVGLSNFDVSGRRTRLLRGATRDQVRAAIRSLKAQKVEDERLLGEVDSLFLVYFTGHGLEERLLLRDGPLTARELGLLVASMKADFTVGVFDACYSGSLRAAALSEKGIDPTPGLNLFRELPEEVLSAEGSVWYVSSGPGQESYEDEQLGGVFTHFFIEALKKAVPDGPGITLESIWQYARQHTVAYTAERKRTQMPERFITKMRSGAPVYFSFPVSRSATLVLSKAIEGRFALAYANSDLTEVFDKPRGRERRLAVYPGEGRLMRIRNGEAVSKQRFSLDPGGTLVLSALPEPVPSANVGERARSLTGKGVAVERGVSLTTLRPGLSFLLGAGYMLDVTRRELLFARHGVALPLRFDVRRAVIDVAPVYGFDRWTFSAWGYRVHKAGARLSGGVGWDLGQLRLTGALSFGFSHLWQTYDSGDKRESWQYRPAATVSVLYPRNGKVAGALFVDVGAVRAQGAGDTDKYVWYPSGTAGLSLFYRVF